MSETQKKHPNRLEHTDTHTVNYSYSWWHTHTHKILWHKGFVSDRLFCTLTVSHWWFNSDQKQVSCLWMATVQVDHIEYCMGAPPPPLLKVWLLTFSLFHWCLLSPSSIILIILFNLSCQQLPNSSLMTKWPIWNDCACLKCITPTSPQWGVINLSISGALSAHTRWLFHP